jgi:CubicO group peptidase (beta-lactamase class C family)
MRAAGIAGAIAISAGSMLGVSSAAAATSPWTKAGQDLRAAVERDLRPLREREAALRQYNRPSDRRPGGAPAKALGPSFGQIARGNAINDPAFRREFWRRATAARNPTVAPPLALNLLKTELLLPLAPISTGGTPWTLEADTRDVRGITYTYEGQTRTVDEYLRSTTTDGVVILHRGKLAFEHYAFGFDATTPHTSASVAKSFISALVGIAVDEGRIPSLDAPIEQYVPALRSTAWEGSTIRQLLHMESGTEWEESVEGFTPADQIFDMFLDYLSNGRMGRDRNEFLRTRVQRFAPPGTVFKYSTGTTQILAWMLESIYGRTTPQLLSEKLWQPMGMESDAAMLTDRKGNGFAGGELFATPRDYARFGQLYLNGGVTPDGRRVISERWISDSTQWSALSEGRYGFQWWRAGIDDPRGFAAAGFQGQQIFVSPTNCMVAVRTAHTLNLRFDSEQEALGVDDGVGEFAAAFDAIARAAGGCSS